MSRSSSYSLSTRPRSTFLHRDLVALERGGEVNQRFAQAEQLDELLILERVVQALLDAREVALDHAQVFQEPARDAEQDLEHKARACSAVCTPLTAPSAIERRMMLSSRQTVMTALLRHDDAHRNGAEQLTAVLDRTFLHHRDIDDHEKLLVLGIDTRAFLRVERRANKLFLNLEPPARSAPARPRLGCTMLTQQPSVNSLTLRDAAVDRLEKFNHIIIPPFSGGTPRKCTAAS